MVWLWCARVAWAVLPLAAGDALTDALDNWSRGPSRVAAVMLWAAWAAGVLALLAPRPWGLTLLRIAAPAAVVLTGIAALTADGPSAIGALGAAVVACVMVLSSPVTEAAGNSLAYGDEARFALRIPTPLLLGPVPLAIAVVGGTMVGPLLIADHRYVAGTAVLAAGIPIGWYLVRALHALSRRWAVLVPAGLVIVDPLTLVDPVLVRREQIESLGPSITGAAELADLRLGTRAGSIALTTRAPVTLVRRAGRNAGATVAARVVLIAPVRPAPLLEAARGRRIPVA